MTYTEPEAKTAKRLELRNERYTVTVTGGTYPRSRAREPFVAAFGPDEGPSMHKIMMHWRESLGLDTILDAPDSRQVELKKMLHHYFMGRTKCGGLVSYVLLGRTQTHELSKQGIASQDLIRHVAYYQESATVILNRGREHHYITVVDLQGGGVLKLASPFILRFGKAYTETTHHHYPGALRKIVILNAPFGTSLVHRLLKGMLPTGLQDKVVVARDHSELQQWVDPEHLPVEYGGTNPSPIWDSEEEQKLALHHNRVRLDKLDPLSN